MHGTIHEGDAGDDPRPRPSRHGAIRRRARRRGLAALIIGFGALAAGSSVTAAATSPASVPPEVGEPTAPDGLGTDPAFNALAEACFGGDLESCDDLYWGAEVGSDYEEYGSTCGGRLVDGVFGQCVETVSGTDTSVTSSGTALPPPTEEPTGLGTDPTLDALAEECHAGAMFACDKLFVLGEEGTPYYDYGYRCAGRQAEGVARYCHELLGFPPPGVDFSTLPDSDDEAERSLIASCVIGDMAACDDLYRQGTETSPYRELADTCAGRQEVGTGILCTAAFPEWEQLLTPPDGAAPVDTRVTPAGDLGEPTDPSGLGDDATFDPLAQSCFEGDLAACDDLYRRTPIGSPYETYGATCGGRLSEPVYGACTEQAGTEPVGPGLAAPTVEPTGLGTDPTLDALAQDCYDGVLFACDRLFFEGDGDSPEQQAYVAFADTCAGRQQPETGLYCHELLGFPAPTADLSGLPSLDPATLTNVEYCLVGDMSACDDIYRSAPEDPALVEFADTCAGRQEVETGMLCTAAFPEYETLYEPHPPTGPTPTPTAPTGPTPAPTGNIPAPTEEPTGLGSDPTMDALAQSCYDGDMQACDDLYNESPVDSAYETYGDTCAGRQPADTGEYCVDSFPG